VIDTISAHGHTYVINNPGGLIGAPISQGRPYERHLLDWIHDSDFEGVALDVGAHVGNHTLWFAVVCGLSVHAFDPTHTAALQVNVTLNDLDDRVHVHGCALGAEVSTACYVGKDKLEPGSGDVTVLPMDSFHFEHVSLIKVDVEDMEPDVLRGGEETIRGQRPTLFLEARDRRCHDLIAGVIEPWGYRHGGTAKTATPVERWLPR
jgi:FkbM family methyltransferase